MLQQEQACIITGLIKVLILIRMSYYCIMLTAVVSNLNKGHRLEITQEFQLLSLTTSLLSMFDLNTV